MSIYSISVYTYCNLGKRKSGYYRSPFSFSFFPHIRSVSNANLSHFLNALDTGWIRVKTRILRYG